MTGSVLAIEHGDLPPDLLGRFRAASMVAWDIETSGLDWRLDRIGTCQLFAEAVGAAIVSVEPDLVPRRLVALLEDAALVKVFHHAAFDLRFMVHAWGVRPASVRCTKVASKLLDPHAPNDSHSLQHLVARYLGVELNKGPVRTSDWTGPTLSPEQIAYATGDVIHLAALLRTLEGNLTRRGLNWLYVKCCEFMPARVALDVGGYPDVFTY